MSFSVGIVGLPNVGKSTLFKALTKQPVDISNYPFCTINPNVGIVEVPDERLEKIAEVVKPDKITPAVIEFVDIAGLVKEAHKGEGLGNQFLSHIREVKIICQVVRAFEDGKIAHVEGQTDPQRDMDIINTELIMKDLETIEKRLAKTKKETKAGQKQALKELEELNIIKNKLDQGQVLEKSSAIASELCLLTAKPIIYVFNVGEDGTKVQLPQATSAIHLNLKLESELTELTEQEIKELELAPAELEKLIKACYQALDLITFYTITGGQETRAWVLKKGSAAPQAGGVVHTDFEEKFIRAEVINWQKLIEAGSWPQAREKGQLQTVGKDYIIKDGDIIEFKI